MDQRFTHLNDLIFLYRGSTSLWSRRLEGRILLTAVKQLNALSKTIGIHRVAWRNEFEAEISMLEPQGHDTLQVVNITDNTCSCRVWQVLGKPYLHALAFICSIRGAEIQAHVDDYYSIEKFRAAYAGSVPSTTYSLDKAQLVESQLRLQSTPTNSKKASRQNQEAEN